MNSETITPTDQFSRIIHDTLPWLAMVSLLTAASTTFLKVFAGTLDANSEILALLYAAPWGITVFLWAWKGRLFAIGGIVVSGAISLTPVANIDTGFNVAPQVALWVLAIVALAVSKDELDTSEPLVRGGLLIAGIWTLLTVIGAFIHLNDGGSAGYGNAAFLSPVIQIGLFSLAGMVTGVVFLFIRPALSMAVAFTTGIPVVVSVFSGYASLLVNHGFSAVPLWSIIQSVVGSPMASVAIGAGAVLAMKQTKLGE